MAKEHLENTTDITMNMGYTNLKKREDENLKNAIHKEREQFEETPKKKIKKIVKKC